MAAFVYFLALFTGNLGAIYGTLCGFIFIFLALPVSISTIYAPPNNWPNTGYL